MFRASDGTAYTGECGKSVGKPWGLPLGILRVAQ